MHGSSPVPVDVSEVGDGHVGQRLRSGWRWHVGEAHTQSSLAVHQILLHPQTNPLLDLHWAANEHQAVPERLPRPLCESTPLAQAHIVSHSLRVEGQRTEAGQATPEWPLWPNNCKGNKTIFLKNLYMQVMFAQSDFFLHVSQTTTTTKSWLVLLSLSEYSVVNNTLYCTHFRLKEVNLLVVQYFFSLMFTAINEDCLCHR